ncbi:TPA: hypothetical protein ACW7MX_004621 [Enterobacter ludwigii]
MIALTFGLGGVGISI